jgi:outer membrane protein OmpA-like peptidoglycan-associated protein
MLITGHTDRIGSHETNQKLSEKRADAVKAYLVSKGAKADSLETMGAGKTQAVPGREVRRQTAAQEAHRVPGAEPPRRRRGAGPGQVSPLRRNKNPAPPAGFFYACREP